MNFKFETIWHYGIAFFETKWELEAANNSINTELFYSGEISEMPREKAKQVAEIHKNCYKYHEDAMMILFKGKGIYSKGTEDPVLAIESYKTSKQQEIDMPYILIWEII